MNPIIQETLRIAEREIGVREVGTNRGPVVEAYLREVGLSPGNPWCAAFVYWCIQCATNVHGVPSPFIRTGYCPSIEAWAHGADLLYLTPQPGDVFLRRSRVNGVERASHTGFVRRVDGNVFATVEGNTNLDGGREGIGVFGRFRTTSPAYRFVRWSHLVAEIDPRGYRLCLNDKPLGELPIREGRALVPVRKWGEALGFDVAWNAEAQVVLFDGHEVPAPILLLDGVAHAPVRALAEFSGLTVTADAGRHEIRVTHEERPR